MERLFDSIGSDQSFYDSLYSCLKEQRGKDLALVRSKYEEGLEEEKEDQVEHDFDVNLDKLDFIPELSNKSEEVQKKFVELSLYIDYLDINSGSKLDSVLTLATLLNGASDSMVKLDGEEGYLLSSSLVSLPVEDLATYGNVLSSKRVLDGVISKSDNAEERRNMIEDMVEYLDDVVYDGMSNEEVTLATSDCMTVLNNYKLQKPTMTGKAL